MKMRKYKFLAILFLAAMWSSKGRAAPAESKYPIVDGREIRVVPPPPFPPPPSEAKAVDITTSFLNGAQKVEEAHGKFTRALNNYLRNPIPNNKRMLDLTADALGESIGDIKRMVRGMQGDLEKNIEDSVRDEGQQVRQAISRTQSFEASQRGLINELQQRIRQRAGQ